ncbi:TetR/AcrR family transcriptional regulator [Lacticaseibacillus mingshuiensis]|uniref:TetR/AcrR family transcriptional regulator n=1 Tax=Lacticaseibacillus mingshuiensis TaxID=2799574 RepID=A0ABW4CGT8_9LACO|nr:TetR/AcrR family transcriptional regulator [Lacticaseibacillus mingshuiensis]
MADNKTNFAPTGMNSQLEAILNATIDALRTQDYAQITFHDLENRTGIKYMTIKRRFNSKAELFAAVQLHELKRVGPAFVKVLDPENDNLLRSYVNRAVKEEVPLFKVMITLPGLSLDDFSLAARTRLDEELGPQYQKLVTQLRTAHRYIGKNEAIGLVHFGLALMAIACEQNRHQQTDYQIADTLLALLHLYQGRIYKGLETPGLRQPRRPQ